MLGSIGKLRALEWRGLGQKQLFRFQEGFVRFLSLASSSLPALLLLSGCSIVVIHNGDVTERRVIPGITIVEISKVEHISTHVDDVDDGLVSETTTVQRPTLLVQTTGIGLLADQRSVTLGWSESQLMEVPDPTVCEAVFLIQDSMQLESALQLVRQSHTGGICVFKN